MVQDCIGDRRRVCQIQLMKSVGVEIRILLGDGNNHGSKAQTLYGHSISISIERQYV